MKERSVLAQRVVTAVIVIPCVVAAVWWLPTIALAVMFGALLLIGALEWTVLMRLRSHLACAAYLFLVAGLLCALWSWRAHDLVVGGVLGASLAWWGVSLVAVKRYPFGPFARDSEFGAATRAGTLNTGAAGLAMLLPAFLALVHLHALTPRGPAWVLLLLALVWAADIGAYFVGRGMGRHKLAPYVSPGKTREGAVGGVLATALAAALAGHFGLGLDGLALAGLVALALPVATASIVGDLAESLFKRTAGVKDAGTLFPGHGGVLDRLDSLLAAAPLFVLALALLNTS